MRTITFPHRRSWLIIATLFLLGAQSPDVPPAGQNISPEVREAATRLAKATEASDMLLQTLELGKDQIAEAVNKQNPGADGRRAVDEIIMPELRQRSGEMVELIVGVWASHFNLEELEQLRVFYETPLGQRSLHELPLVMQEAQEAGARWGQKAFQDIFKERAGDLRALGVDVAR